MYQMWHYLCRGIPLISRCVRDKRSEEPEEGRVCVDVVERSTVVDLWEVIEDICVQSRIHALPGTTCRKWSVNEDKVGRDRLTR